MRTLEARLAGICSNDPGGNAGGDGGGGGGGGASPAASAPAAAPASSAPASAPAAAPTAAPARPATNVPLDRAGLAEHMRQGVRSANTNAPPAVRQPAAAPAAAPTTSAPVQNAAGRWYDPSTGRMVAAPATAPAPAAPAAPVAPAATPPSDMAQLISRLDRLIPALAQPAAAPAQPAAAADPQSTPFYGGYVGPVTLQPEVFELLESEHPDDRAMGLSTLVNQSLNTVMRDTISFVTAVRNDIMAQIGPIVAQIIAQQAAHNGFFERYPQLNRAELRPTLDAIGRQVANEWQAQGRMGRASNGALTPDFMDAVAARFAQIMHGTVGAPPAANPAPVDPAAPFGYNTPAAAAPAPQPFLRRTAARPPAASPLAAKSADILHTINTR